MKKHYHALLGFALLGVASVVTVLAQFFAGKGTASWFILHQPETPECLK